MIRTLTYVQRAWVVVLGVGETVVVVRHRVRCTPAVESPARRPRPRKLVLHSGFRDLPLFKRRHKVARCRSLAPMLPARVTVLPERPLLEPKRSSHPKRVTLAERKTWIGLKQGWDEGRPGHRVECRGDKRCPGCGHLVAMRIQDGGISCPDCKVRVGYARGLNCADWYWAAAGQENVVVSPGKIPMAALSRCRPCPWVSCRSHLYLEVDSACGSLKLNHRGVPADRMEELEDTCAEDVAERDVGRVGLEPKVLPLEVVGRHLGLTLERARQIEADAMTELSFRMKRREKRETG